MRTAAKEQKAHTESQRGIDSVKKATVKMSKTLGQSNF